jgi:hypothetical protein
MHLLYHIRVVYVQYGICPGEAGAVCSGQFSHAAPCPPGSPERLLGRMADPINRIDLIEVAKQPRLMRTFALQFGYANPYVMEGERPRESQPPT